jgi:hypothetical protein
MQKWIIFNVKGDIFFNRNCINLDFMGVIKERI